jgi:hypothetical protein
MTHAIAARATSVDCCVFCDLFEMGEVKGSLEEKRNNLKTTYQTHESSLAESVSS